MSNEQWEVVDSVSGDLNAEMLRGLLEAQGIPVMLSQEGAGRAIGINVGALGEVEILVPTSSKSKAKQIIQEYYAGDFESEEDQNTGDDT